MELLALLYFVKSSAEEWHRQTKKYSDINSNSYVKSDGDIKKDRDITMYSDFKSDFDIKSHTFKVHDYTSGC